MIAFINIYFYTLSQNVRIQYLHNFGSIEGFSQIPKGGQSNSSSIKEPTFDQLGVNHINYSKILIGFPRDNWEVYFELKNNPFKGKNRLDKVMKTHDILLPSNTKIESKNKYNFYNIGLKYSVYKNKKIEISPKIEASIFDFKYSFSAENKDKGVFILNDARNFKAGGVRVGGNIKYCFNDSFVLISDLMMHMPYGNIKKSLECSLTLSQNIYRKSNKEINLLYGIGYDYFKFRDSQHDMQNRIEYKISPMYTIGIELKI